MDAYFLPATVSFNTLYALINVMPQLWESYYSHLAKELNSPE